MKEKLRYWWRKFTTLLGIGFGVIGSLAVLFPFDAVTETNIWNRMALLIAFVFLGFLISIIWVYYEKNKKCNQLFSFEKAKVIFEYGDIKSILFNEVNKNENTTIVVPCNTSLNTLIDREIINASSIHGICLEYLFSKRSKELTLDIFKNTRGSGKNADFSKDNPLGERGHWFLIEPEEVGLDNKVRFLFIEMYDLYEENGIRRSVTTDEQYLRCIQVLLENISLTLKQGEKVYIPLIGAGQGSVRSREEIMHILAAVLKFNKRQLKQEIHIIIEDELKSDVPIYQL